MAMADIFADGAPVDKDIVRKHLIGPAVNIQGFGAIGDGSHDDTPAIQAAIDALPQDGGVLYLPTPPVFYRITDSLKFGEFRFNRRGDVTGFRNIKSGVLILGAFGNSRPGRARIKWDGAPQRGAARRTQSDSIGAYSYIGDAKAMFHVVQCRHLTFQNLYIDGGHKAFAGFHFEGNQDFMTIDHCVIDDCWIGIRNGTRWDYVADRRYYGIADSPYFRTQVRDMVRTGGWKADGHVYQNSRIRGCNVCISQESQQAIQTRLDNIQLKATGPDPRHCIAMAGGQIIGHTVGLIRNNGSASIRAYIGGNRLFIVGMHDETRNPVLYQSTTRYTEGSELYLVRYDGHNDILINSGGGRYTFIDCEVGTFHRIYNRGARCFLNIQNSKFRRIELNGDNPTNPPTMFINASQVDRANFAGAFLTGDSAERWIGEIAYVDPPSGIGGRSKLWRDSYLGPTNFRAADGKTSLQNGVYRFADRIEIAAWRGSAAVLGIPMEADGRVLAVRVRVTLTLQTANGETAVRSDTVDFACGRDRQGRIFAGQPAVRSAAPATGTAAGANPAYGTEIVDQEVVLHLRLTDLSRRASISLHLEGEITGDYGLEDGVLGAAGLHRSKA